MRESKEFKTLRKPKNSKRIRIEMLTSLRDKFNRMKSGNSQNEVEVEKFKALLESEGTNREDSDWLIGQAQEIAKIDKPTGQRMINLDVYSHHVCSAMFAVCCRWLLSGAVWRC